MKTVPLVTLACPIDGVPLNLKQKALKCEQGHSYDISREGYHNLLLVQQKGSQDPGDSKEMVDARRRFLSLGYFESIAGKLFEEVSEVIGEKSALSVLDAGCGEGYYLESLAKNAVLSSSQQTFKLAGIDISKPAIRLASKRSSNITWAVASNKSIPFQKASIDLILCMFGFPVWEGFQKVQTAGGKVLLVDPGPEHLIELRRAIYPKLKESEGRDIAPAIESGYKLVKQSTLQFEIDVKSQSDLQDLLLMTPHAFKISRESQLKLSQFNQLHDCVDLSFRVLELSVS